MARYGGVADVAWKMGRIMLKYRPIAPKPVMGGAVAVGSVNIKSNGGRGKRKGGLKEGRRGRKRGKRDAEGVFFEDELKKINDNNNNSNSLLLRTEVVTLPLMPVTPERKEESLVGTPSPTASDGHVAVNYWEKTCVYQPYTAEQGYKKERESTVRRTKLPESCQNSYISFSALSGRIASYTQNNNKNNFLESATSSNDDSSNSNSSGGGSSIFTPQPVRPVGSWVTIESLTDMWRDREVPLPALEYDTCPSFVSDACYRVTWTNVAYKRMVVGSTGSRGEEEEVRVALVTRGMVPRDFNACFTCRARVKHACREGGKVSMVVPCDVWRLGDGRLAWRLDVKAALSLSLGCEM